MGGEVEEPVNSSNLINRLQPLFFFLRELVLQPRLHKVLAESFLGLLASCHTFILDKWFFEYFFNAPLNHQSAGKSLKVQGGLWFGFVLGFGLVFFLSFVVGLPTSDYWWLLTESVLWSICWVWVLKFWSRCLVNLWRWADCSLHNKYLGCSFTRFGFSSEASFFLAPALCFAIFLLRQ